MAPSNLPTLDKPENPFHPGIGSFPEHFAGREDELEVLESYLPILERGDSPDHAVFVTGPRGNGKTCLVTAFQRSIADLAKNTRGKLRVKCTSVKASKDVSLQDLSRQAFHSGFLRRQLSRVRTSVSLFGLKMRVEDELATAASAAFCKAAIDYCQSQPVVLCVDEAHELAIPVLGDLLRATEFLVSNSKTPFLLLLAGTPKLKSTLAGAKVTFTERCEEVSVGPLTSDAASDALCVPLANAGLGVEPPTLARILDECHNYPWFIQRFGKFLYDACVESAQLAVNDQAFDSAKPKFEERRRKFYGDRYLELGNLGLVQVARSVARMILSSNQTEFYQQQLVNQIQADLSLQETEAHLRFTELSTTGFIWNHRADLYAAGIPSLMRYVLEHSPESRDNFS